MNLAPLVELSRRYGSDDLFAIAGGGNTSVKTDTTLWVKASGIALGEIDESGFVAMDRAALQHLLNASMPVEPAAREEAFKQAVLAARLSESGPRPSVESVLHHLLDAPYVVHTHSTRVNAATCARDGRLAAAELWGGRAVWVPYVDPGCVLAKDVAKLVQAHCSQSGRKYPEIVILQNHGLIVCGDSPEQIDATTAWLIGRLPEPPAPPAPAPCPDGALRTAAWLRVLMAEDGARKVVAYDGSPEVRRWTDDPQGREAVERGPLSPDQIVYCKSFPLWSKAEDPAALKQELAAHEAATGFPAKVVLVPGAGLFAIGATAKDADIVRRVYKDALRIMAWAAPFGGFQPLAKRDREFIDAWEVENYRRQVMAASRARGRLEGRIALVTGGAQGFGLGIAEGLLAEGAHVALADLSPKVKDEAARLGPRACALTMNVTDPASVKAALDDLVQKWGGVDLVVSNAGVLRAGSVKEQKLEDFRFVQDVNTNGYFVVVQAAAPLMAHVREADPLAWTDIVQVNSKSGLQGSNRNGAYAGSKFAGIGLTQSFALELIEDGIKVNAVCPGNYFEGPLWSDPENGLFAQYLRTGKVPGANTVDEVRAFYEAKVPMGRGCRPSDVVKAILYLVEQEYETGQAIAVTGGQVMLG